MKTGIAFGAKSMAELTKAMEPKAPLFSVPTKTDIIWSKCAVRSSQQSLRFQDHLQAQIKFKDRAERSFQLQRQESNNSQIGSPTFKIGDIEKVRNHLKMHGLEVERKTDLELVIDEQEVLTESETPSLPLKKRPVTALRTRTETMLLLKNGFDAPGQFASNSAKKLG